jgi:large subunit ribosomal protein L25
MAEIVLEVSRRETTGKETAKKLRRDGKLPAVVYGGHREPVSITVDQKDLSDLIRKSEHGVRSVFLLKMKDSDQKRHAMIKDVVVDPISRKMQHVDFVRVMMDEKVRVAVPLHAEGMAAGVKLGGMLDFQLRELHVECLPGQIPDEINVDVTSLNIGDVVRIADLQLPEGVKVLDESERVVLSVHGRKAEEETAAEAEAAESVEPEVIKKGKVEAEA